MKVYQPLQQKDLETGLWYKEWDIPEGFPIAEGLILVAPDASLHYPKWDSVTGFWIEDTDSIIEYLKSENNQLIDRINMTESALLDLADMILSR